MFAVIEIKGQQFRVSEDDIILVNLLGDVKTGDKIEAEKVLMIADEDGSDVKIGTPLLNASVQLEVIEAEEKGEKIYIFKMKAKKRYRRKAGHRSIYSRLQVKKIGKATVKKSSDKEENVEKKSNAKKEEANV